MEMAKLQRSAKSNKSKMQFLNFKMQNAGKTIHVMILFVSLFLLPSAYSQSPWPSLPWNSAVNLTGILDPNGVTELSGLHWNPTTNRLYMIDDHGRVRILQLNLATHVFTQIVNKPIDGGPEGITQADYNANEFYTIDENNYEIRKYTHHADFTSLTLSRHWNLLAPPSPMQNTGNTGPEGIVFIPDSFLSSIGFISDETGQAYTSTKGMGGLMFVAHQDGGYIWVFDVNPNTNDDFAYVGKYKSNRAESCDLAFDRTTGLLYILHNIGDNSLEVTNLTTSLVSGERKFADVNEYFIPNPSGNDNIEGFAISPKCNDSANVSAWLCRDVAIDESTSDQKDCLRWFQPYTADGICLANTNSASSIVANDKVSIFPNPAKDQITVTYTSSKKKKIHVKLFNMQGEIVLEKINFNEHVFTLDISSLKKGMYLMELREGKNITGIKFMKE